MRPIYYSTCSKATAAEKKKEDILRECRDLNALIKANLCYIPYEQRAEFLTSINRALPILDPVNFALNN